MALTNRGALASICAAIACAPEAPGRYEESWSDRSDGGGLLPVEVYLTEARNQALVVVDAPPFTSLEVIEDPWGDLVLSWEDWAPPNPRSLTWSVFAMGSDSPLNWPVRAEDGPLEPGTWTFVYSTLDDEYRYLGRQDAEITVITKVDPDLTTGTLPVTLFVPAGTTLGDVIDEAVLRFQEIWAEVGITVDVEVVEAALDDGARDPSLGSAAYADLARAADGRVPVVLTEAVVNANGNDTGLYGKVGSIPNALSPTRRAALVVSWLAHAGRDGLFNAGEVRVLGETLAHEVGHYAGLFHPVESGYDAWDALSDTPECGSEGDCDRRLGTHLMYPYPLCGLAGTPDSCATQDVLSADQAGVLHRYVGVD